MEALRERLNVQETEAEKAQRHNDAINENFKKFERYFETKFEKDDTQVVATETPVAPVQEEEPLYISPSNVGKAVQETSSRVSASPMAAALFTPQRYEMMQETHTAPVEISAPVKATKTAVEASYGLTPLAKVVMAAFTVVVVAMLALICMNTQIIRQKRIRIQNLEEKKQQLLEESQEIQRRIEAAQSEETIRQYALENGIALGK